MIQLAGIDREKTGLPVIAPMHDELEMPGRLKCCSRAMGVSFAMFPQQSLLRFPKKL